MYASLFHACDSPSMQISPSMRRCPFNSDFPFHADSPLMHGSSAVPMYAAQLPFPIQMTAYFTIQLKITL